MSKMREHTKRTIIQMLPILAYGDAIGNDVLALDHAITECGYRSEIYAESIDHRLKGTNIHPISKYKDNPNNILIYHLSTGHAWNRKVASFQANLVLHYHNITPPYFFRGYNVLLEKVCMMGLEDAAWLHDKAIFCIADSEFNKQDLLRMGYACPIEVLPIILAYDDYNKTPDQSVIDAYGIDGQTNIIFTGRVAPNKKQEDLIKTFYYYHKYLNSNSMLHIVGGYESGGRYYQKLSEYTKCLGLAKSVNFTGHIPFDQILAYYKLADIFLCMSEHEGFCVPLVEAMYFHVPIIAYNATAVGDTLGMGGILLDEKDPVVTAEAVHYVQQHREVRDRLIEQGTKQIALYSAESVKKKLREILDKIG